MGFIANLDAIVCATDLVKPEITHFVAEFMNLLYGWIGNYGWTVVVFTLILKVVLSPLDIWQKVVMHKNNRAMKRMKPQIEKLQKQYANDKQTFQTKQLQLYKQEGYSMMGSCLPMIVTLVVFFIVFAGFNSMATYRVQMDIYEIATVYEAKVDEMKAEDSTLTSESPEVIEAAEQAVLEYYNEHRHEWLWVRNVFMGDNWSSVFPSYEEFTGTGMGSLGVSTEWIGDTTNTYDKYTSVIRNHPDYQGWNGYLIMPVLTILVTLGSQFLMRQQTPPTVDGEASAQQNNMMKFMMPIMMGFFAVFYSSAFTIYLLVSQLFSLVFSLIFNLITDAKDKKEDEYILTHTYKRK